METREKIDDWHKRNENFAAKYASTSINDEIAIPEYSTISMPEIEEDVRSLFSIKNSRCDDAATAFFDEYQQVPVKTIDRNTGIPAHRRIFQPFSNGITSDKSTFLPGGAEGDHIYRSGMNLKKKTKF